MFRPLNISSHKGKYSVEIKTELDEINILLTHHAQHYLIDSNVARLYSEQLLGLPGHQNSIIVDATEANKCIDSIIPIIERLVANGVRRNHTLVAIGGGIIQDITCFISSILLRGIPWKFFPTTLLAQSDSCIGSKSSINLGDMKNMLGTFNPPAEIFICPKFLDTLEKKEILSGIGEILKVHAIDGLSSFKDLAKNYKFLFADRDMLIKYIYRSLEIKKRFIEVDEFDHNVRNIFNYGHSFGHAIESASHFLIPHGIAISIGMDMANFISMKLGNLNISKFREMHDVFRQNYALCVGDDIQLDLVIAALAKDKKNTSTSLVLILPFGEHAQLKRVEVKLDNNFINYCDEFIHNFFYEHS